MERKTSSCKITLTITKSKPLHHNSNPSALLMPQFMGSCWESGGEIRLFLERNERNATAFLHHSDFSICYRRDRQLQGKILQWQGEQKQQGKMETLKDITKSSHVESSRNMGGEEREKRHLEGVK